MYLMIKENTTGIFAENIPIELRERPQWVCWRYEERRGKLTKIPQTPSTSYPASSTDLMTWTTFEKALAAYEASDRRPSRACDGIGFVFSSADPFAGIDLDKCRNPESGEIKPWAQEILDRVPGAYVEASPSGTGIHIIVKGKVRDGGMRKGRIEMYSRGRFFTVTGVPL
jgi:primase-polymerase (primpol)-like protein